MTTTHIIRGLLAAFLLASGTGCKQSQSDLRSVPPESTALSPDAIVRVHWMGKRQLGVTASAFTFKRYWDLDQSRQLEGRTLDKISIAPWRLLQNEAALAEAPGIVLRPLLNDIVQEECYFEVRGRTNQPIELVFAINLDDRRAGLWRTNLAFVIASLTRVHNMDLQDRGRGWSIKKPEPPNHIELARVGEWTVVGLAQEKNNLLDEVVARIQRDRVPYSAPGTNDWLEADVDLNRAARALSLDWKSSEDLPRFSFNVTGDGGNVITRVQLNFPQPLPIELEPWTIPTQMMHEPLVSFTAVRGFKSWLAAQKFWTAQLLGTPPDQIYFWALEGAPVLTCFAAPLPEAGNRVRQFSQRLLEQANPWLATNGYVGFERLPDANGVTWGSMSNLMPFVKSVETEQGSMVFGGLLPDTGIATNRPPPAGMIQDVLRRTNLVYYDWEVTSPRIDSWLYIGQLVREVSRHPQLPMDSTSAAWLNALRPRLGNSATVVTLSETNQLTFIRRSTFGFTGVELHLLADWFESPQFPLGLYSLLGPPGAVQ